MPVSELLNHLVVANGHSTKLIIL